MVHYGLGHAHSAHTPISARRTMATRDAQARTIVACPWVV
jgi:hypothetical protein